MSTPPTAQTATIDVATGVRLAYRDVGTGEPILLIMSAAGSLGIWARADGNQNALLTPRLQCEVVASAIAGAEIVRFDGPGCIMSRQSTGGRMPPRATDGVRCREWHQPRSAPQHPVRDCRRCRWP